MRVPKWMTLLALLVFAGLLIVLTLLWLEYDRFPDRVPAHFGLTGEPDRFRAKTPGAIFGPVALGLAVSFLLWMNVWALERSPALSQEQQRVGMYMMAALATFVALMVTLLSIVPLMDPIRILGGPWLIAVNGALILLTAIIGLIRWLRLPSANRPAEGSLLVERGDGLGMTVNLKHPLAWVYPVAFVLVLASAVWLAFG